MFLYYKEAAIAAYKFDSKKPKREEAVTQIDRVFDCKFVKQLSFQNKAK